MLREIIENKIKEIKLLKHYNDADLEKIINEYKPRGFLNALKKKERFKSYSNYCRDKEIFT